MGHHRHPQFRARVDLHVLRLHGVPRADQRVSCRCFVVVLIGVAVGAAMSLLIQVLAFEQIIERAKDKRSAEMQILIGGIGIATIPLAIAQHETKSNPFGFTNSTFQVTRSQLRRLRITNIADHHDRASASGIGVATACGCAGPGRASHSGRSASTPRSPRSWASTGAGWRWDHGGRRRHGGTRRRPADATASARSRPRAATCCSSRRSPHHPRRRRQRWPVSSSGRSSSRPLETWS